MNDLRYSLRSLVRMRGVAVLALAALAVGIGATTTMFSAADAALLRPVPFEDPDRLVLLFTARTTPREGRVLSRWSKPLIDVLEGAATSYEAIASFTPSLVGVSGGNAEPEQIAAEIVSPEYFGILRIRPAVGRTFTASEDRAPGDAPVAVLSERLWRGRYGADPSLVGGTVRINDVPLTIVGIMPAGFAGLSDKAEVWLPRAMAPRLTYAEYLTTPQLFIGAVARLKPGVTLERANGELAAAAAAMPLPANVPGAQWSAIAQRIGDARVDPALRRSVLLLLAAAACVVLITCANVGSLLLARGRVRSRELAVRMAIGSGRARIVRLLLTESVVVAAIAGACGLLLASWGVRLFAQYAPGLLGSGRSLVSPFSAPSLNGRALLFTAALTVATSLTCGLLPAVECSRVALTNALKSDERSGGRRRVFRGLVVMEVALAVLLLGAAGILLDGFARAQRLQRGFETSNVLTFWVRPSGTRYPVEQGPRIVERLLTAVQRVPGVESAAVNRCTPFTGCSRSIVFFADRPNDRATAPGVGRHYASADYFRTLGIPLLAGRVLSDDDRPGRPAVTVISESAARRFWPGQSPIGKRVWFGTTTGPFADAAHSAEIVGVVGDVKYEAVDSADPADRPQFYTSYLQFAFPDTMIIVKTRGAVASLVPSIRHAVAAIDPALPIYGVMTLDDRIADALSQPRFNAGLTAAFAATALLVAALGVYGMLSYFVSTRLREIGVRLALGAAPSGIVRFVLGDGLRLAAIGVAVGVALAFAAARFARSVIPDLGVVDPRIVAIAAATMLATACTAALLPARRASAVDPIVVLRQE